MTTTALIISNDLILRSETRAVLSELEIVCTCSGYSGLERALQSGKFDCIYLDLDYREKALAAVERVRIDRLNRYAIVFALSERECEVPGGISYVVRRSPDFYAELKRSFLSARSLVLGEKRRHERHPVDLEAFCVCGDRITEARLVDLSERGACLEYSSPILIPIMQLSFSLPGTEHQIQTDVKVAWREAGKAGVQFVSISEGSRIALRDWLAGRAAVCA